jgi:hypothetical protein
LWLVRLDLPGPLQYDVGLVQLKFKSMQQEVAVMRTDPLPHEVRELVLRTFESFDVPIYSPWDLDETIVIDEGRYSARTYKIDDYMAMWLVEIGIVQFYDDEGNMLLTVNLLEELEPQRMRMAA